MKSILHFAALLLTCLPKGSICEDLRNVGFLLPGNIIPSHYNLRWIITDDCSDKPEFGFNTKFNGIAEVTMKAVKPDVDVIEMNAKSLNFSRVTIKGNGFSETNLQPIFYKREEKVLFKLPFKLPVFKPVTLNILFEGRMSYETRGMFIANEIPYDNGNEISQRNVIGTILEPAYARKVYPCFDEPQYKATFTISIDLSQCALKKGYTAYSNAKLEMIEHRGDRAIIHFEKTNVVMSTYLMTIGIAPFISTPHQQFNSSYPDASKTEWKDLRTWGTREFVQSNIAPIVQKAGVRLMEIFTADLRMGYPLKKMDQLQIIPRRMAGMENWGVVFYGFSMSQLGSVSLVAHELAHQWFGNLVTCHWWSDTWLNEGFATYFSTYGAHKFSLEDSTLGEWKPLLDSVHDLAAILSYDVFKSRPLTQPVEDPNLYKKNFDFIAYVKGASVIRMWNNTLGEKAFLKAMNKYLDERKLNVATPKHLLKAFDSVADESDSSFDNGLPSRYFEKWITQRGYPLVTVKKSPTNSSVYILTQKVFKATPDATPMNWTIPISYATSSDKNFNRTHAMLWFREEDETAVITLPNPVKWIIVNNMFTGYYRVDYDAENWVAIFQTLINTETYSSIPEENRIQIIADLNALATETLSFVNYDFVMNLMLYLKHETEYYPWKATLKIVFNFMDAMMSKSKTYYELFKKYVRDLLQENYSRLGFKNVDTDSYPDKQLRIETAKWACRMGHAKCISDSIHFLKGCSPSDNIYNKSYEEYKLCEIAYCTSVGSTVNDWNTLWRKYSSAKNFEEKKSVLRGISCSKDKNILKRLLMKSIDDSERLTSAERQLILTTVMNADPRNIDTAFDFFTSNYEDINEMYPGKRSVANLLLQFAEKLGTDDELCKMKAFLRTLENDADIIVTTTDIENALTITENNNVWIREKSNDLSIWLIKRYKHHLINT